MPMYTSGGLLVASERLRGGACVVGDHHRREGGVGNAQCGGASYEPGVDLLDGGRLKHVVVDLPDDVAGLDVHLGLPTNPGRQSLAAGGVADTAFDFTYRRSAVVTTSVIVRPSAAAAAFAARQSGSSIRIDRGGVWFSRPTSGRRCAKLVGDAVEVKQRDVLIRSNSEQPVSDLHAPPRGKQLVGGRNFAAVNGHDVLFDVAAVDALNLCHGRTVPRVNTRVNTQLAGPSPEVHDFAGTYPDGGDWS